MHMYTYVYRHIYTIHIVLIHRIICNKQQRVESSDAPESESSAIDIAFAGNFALSHSLTLSFFLFHPHTHTGEVETLADV